MKLSIIKTISFLGIILLAASCHKGEDYSCYLIDETNWWEFDTISHYGEGLIYKKDRPETKCYEEKERLDTTSYNPGPFRCSCDWRPE